MSDTLYNSQNKLDLFVESCLDAVLQRYRRFHPEEKSKRAKAKWKKDNELRRTGKKGGKYVY